MNLQTVLREIGATDREMEHLLGCDDCEVWNGNDGAEVFRCAVNPQRLHDNLERDLYRCARALLRFMGCQPRRGLPLDGFDALFDVYRQQVMDQLSNSLPLLLRMQAEA